MSEPFNLIKEFTAGNTDLMFHPAFSDSLDKFLKEGEPADIDAFKKIQWKLSYRIKPPSMAEFMTEEWIGSLAYDVYNHVRQISTDFWKQKDKSYLYLSTAIGVGKSFISVLSQLYITTLLSIAHNPRNLLGGVSRATPIIQLLVSFTEDKATELLVAPILQALEVMTNRFVKVQKHGDIVKKAPDYPDKILWSRAGAIGAISFPHAIYYKLSSSPQKLLGMSIISGVVSEISFFIDQGYSPEYIWRILQDLIGRIFSRFKHHYLARVFIDSSPNDLEYSPIDKYIYSGAVYENPRNMVVRGAQWEFLPDNYPLWKEDKTKIFKVFLGNGKERCKILTEQDDVDLYPANEVSNVPIDLIDIFKGNLEKSIKDYVGYPSGLLGKLFNRDAIEGCFTPLLDNVYDEVIANASDLPKGVIMAQVKDKLFMTLNGKVTFARAPKANRYIHVDLAESSSGKNRLGIACCHKELDIKHNEVVYVYDFAFAVNCTENDRISLMAVEEFILELNLATKGRIKKVTYDSYQSSGSIQNLKRAGIEASILSIDTDLNIYLTLNSNANLGFIKIGRNIILKNNFNSLIIKDTGSEKSTRRKRAVDHLIGNTTRRDSGNWTESLMGQFEKDISDATAGSFWNALMDIEDVLPTDIWDDRAEKYSEKDYTEANIKDYMKKHHLSFKEVPLDDVIL